jgi:signal transduction histidine kinase/ligand-binding sensor domain-containing protein
MRLKFILIILISILSQQGYSLVLNLNFNHLTIEKGLSNNTVYCVFQDSKGFMWFGTDYGLNMFDGYEFKIFSSNSNDSTSILSNAVFKVLEDSKGRLWIATDYSISIYNRDLMSFKNIPLIKEDEKIPFQNYVWDIIEGMHGEIFIVNTTDIFIYDTLKHGFVRYINDIEEYKAFKKDGIRTFLKDRNNRIWIGSISFGLFAYDLGENKLIASPASKGIIEIKDQITSIIENVNGDIWIGTNNGIYVVKSDLTEVNTLKANKNTNSLSSNKIFRIYSHCKKRIWIGTDGGGLNLYNNENSTFTRFVSNEFNSHDINNNFIYSIFEGNQGILWIGTYHGGVNYAQLDKSKQFILYENEPGNPNSLIYNAVAAIRKDKEGNLWIGTDGGGLDYYNINANKYKHFTYNQENPNSISGNSILTIAEDKNGNIWIGGYLLGINLIDKNTGRITRYKHDPFNSNSLSADDVRDIYIDKESNLWIATNGGGLDKLNLTSNTFIHYGKGGENSLISNWCLKIFEDSFGNLWIGTYGGISIFDIKNNVFHNYFKGNITGSISNNWIYSFAEDGLKNIWVGTAAGLNYYNRNTNSFTTISKSEGLPNEVINGILIDTKNNLWISTNKGISKYNPVDRTIKNFDVFDGLQGNQFIHGSYFMDNTGKMYFGGLNGFNFFHPDSIEENKFIPPVFITNLLLSYKELEINKDGSPLTKSITETDKIVLTYKQSVITFRYTALNYLNSEKNQYAYQLEGIEKDWNYVGSRREATFTNLDPGKYTFKVKASNNDGVWNEEGTSIRIIILPPFWKTIWFKLIILFTIGFLLISVYLIRVKQLNNQKKLLEKLVSEKTAELRKKNKLLEEQALELNKTNTLLEERQQKIEEQSEELKSQKEQLQRTNEKLHELNATKDKFFSIIAHDIKNPFNTIMGFSELLILNFNKWLDEKKLKVIEVIFSSSKSLYELLENLLQWSRSQRGLLGFNPVKLEFKDSVERVVALLKHSADAKGIEFKIYLPVKGLAVHADPQLLDTILRNLISNAMKFTPKGGQIQVKAEPKDNFALVAVIDNGVGMLKEDIDKLFRIDMHYTSAGTNEEKGTGLGLILVKEFVTKQDGEIWVESDVGKGSTFFFTIPLERIV